MYSRVRIGKYLSDNFPIQNGLKQGDALSPLLFNFALEQCFSTFSSPRTSKMSEKILRTAKLCRPIF
jgi:hypothetical protein